MLTRWRRQRPYPSQHLAKQPPMQMSLGQQQPVGVAPLPPKPKGNPAWKPGVSANPAGRPKTAILSREIREQLSAPSAEDPSRTNAAMIAEALIKRAKKGDHRCAETLLDRSEGKVPQKLLFEAAQLAARFEKLSSAELTEYAVTGLLPALPSAPDGAVDAPVDAEFVDIQAAPDGGRDA